MTISLYEELISISTFTEPEIKRKLIDLDVAHVFQYILEEHKEKGWVKPIVMFTAHTYSWESKMIKLGMDWKKQKRGIADRVAMPPDAYPKVVDLQDEMMADMFRAFLGLYRDNMDYVHLVSLKELYQQIMANATKFVGKEDGSADMDKKFKDIEKADELKKKIEALEKKVREELRVLDPAKKELKFDAREHGNPLLVENSKMIRRI